MPIKLYSIFFALFCLPAIADIEVRDDTGVLLSLEKAATKIISLSPGLTELIVSAGGLAKIIAVVNYSDFPQQVKSLPQIGSYNALDIEKILLLQPDLIVAWKSGSPAHQIKKLKKLGLKVYISEPDDFMDIPDTVLRLGKLMATDRIAQKNAQHFSKQFARLKAKAEQNSKQKKKTVFIQIWNQPLMTVNQHHLISKIIHLCGGENIFADTLSLTATPSVESILAKNPDIIIISGSDKNSIQWLNDWQRWLFLKAVKNKRLHSVNADHLVRHTFRILQGIEQVCQLIL